MVCYRPLVAYKTIKKNPETGKNYITFSKPTSSYTEIQLPCGQCIGCRLERSRQWAIRCSHEAQMYEHNCFITLTYDNEHLPEDMSLDVREFQLFMKRLRKFAGDGIRFFHCGEYGETYGRPHYHACIFNYDFPDKIHWSTQNCNKYYISEHLNRLWGKGYAIIGDVTFQSAAYVARYITKKVTGDHADEHYEYINPITGEITQRKPEYITMSRRPGIGATWFEKYKNDVYPHDEVIINGKSCKPPRYYDTSYEMTNPYTFRVIQKIRERNALLYLDKHGQDGDDRLYTREQVKLACVSEKLYRNLEKEI